MKLWQRSKWTAFYFVSVLLVILPATGLAQVTTTTVQGTVYRADGSPASGTLIVNWPAFTTAANQAIAAGSISTEIGADGFVSIALAPNQNSYPAGTYYTAIYHLADGTVNREYWVVPSAPSASIGSVRAQIEPASVAVQTVSKNYVDSSISALSSNFLSLTGGSMSGPLTLSGDPTAQGQAASKHYVDDMISTDLPLAGGNMLGTLETPDLITKGPRVNILDSDFGLGQPVKGVNVLNGSCTSNPSVAIPAPLFSADGSHATAQGICINGQTQVYITFPGGGYTSSQVPVITGGGTSGATGTLILAGNAGPADPTGVKDSSAAILNAADYIQGLGYTKHSLADLYIPQGTYRLIDPVRLPCDVPVTGDGEDATILEPVTDNENGLTLYGGSSAQSQPNSWDCNGSISDLTIYSPNAHNYRADLLELLGVVGETISHVTLSNGGGRGINLQQGAERNFISDLTINTTAWPGVIWGNENHLQKINIASPGETDDNYCFSTGFSYVSNCVNGVAPDWSLNHATIMSASANGSLATFYVKGTYSDGTSQSTSPIVDGLHFTVAGTTGTDLDGTYTVTNTVNNVSSDPSGQCTTSSECFEVQAASTQNGTAAVANATWQIAILPDRNSALYVSGADDAINYGSIKALWYSGGVTEDSVSGGRVSNIYFEGYPAGNSHDDSAITLGGSMPRTTLTVSLPGSEGEYSVVPVASTLFFPAYINDPMDTNADISNDVGNFRIACADYLYGSTEPCANNPSVERGEWEDVQGIMASDGLHISQRNESSSTAPAGTSWPAGSIIEVNAAAGSSYGAVTIVDNHLEPIDAGTAGYSDDCSDSAANICASILVGTAPDMLSAFTPHSRPLNSTFSGGERLLAVFLLENEMRGTDLAESIGGAFVKFIGGGGNAYLAGWTTSNEEAYDATASTGQFAGENVVNVQNTDGSYPDSELIDYDNGLYFNSAIPDSYSKQVSEFDDPVTGTNPNINSSKGIQFEGSYCYYDTPSAVGGHSLNRFCFKGSPDNQGSYAGVEFDTWNGSAWVNGFTLAPGAASAVNLNVTGAGNFPGGLTASTINGEITVDGTTYKTLNSAWTAALTAANRTGQNQTVRLGPGQFNVTATMTEPTNGSCVNLIGSGGTATSADVTTAATTLSIGATLSDAVFQEGNTAQAQGCTFKDLNILANQDVPHGFDFEWFRGMLMNNIAVNDSTAEGILLGEESTSSGHQSNFLMRNVTVSYNSADFTPASRPAYGIHLQKTAIDSSMDNILVRNALTASVYNEGTGNTGYLIHGFGYPYTCTTAPCVNNATSSSAANASYATSYVIYDTGGGGSDWADTYVDSPAIAGFYIGANGVEIHGGHIQWPDLTSFPSANLAYVAAGVTNNLLISDVSCLGMSSSANWITYANASGTPPTFSSVHHLTGCGNYYQALEPAVTTGFSSGGANINDPSGTVPRVWATPLSAAANEAAYAVQMYTGYEGDAYEAHFSGVSPFFNVTYQGTIRSNGGLALNTVTNTASTLTLTTANRNVIANASGGPQTITLPSCYTPMPDKMTPTGLQLTIIKSDTSANAVTLQTVSSQTIDYQGSTSQTLTISSPGARNLVCGPDYNWYAY